MTLVERLTLIGWYCASRIAGAIRRTGFDQSRDRPASLGRLNTIRGVESNSRQFYPATSDPERRVHPEVYRLKNGRIYTSTIDGAGLGYRWNTIESEFEMTVLKLKE